MNNELYHETKAVMEEFGRKSNLKTGDILVVGCSTSEVIGSKIGTNSNPEIAKAVFQAIYDYTTKNGLYLAAQCCEHLNRAIIIERDAVPFAEVVNVIPQPKAGGSFATQAYAHFRNPVAVEEIKADAGIDIGSTLIGMHLKKVAVPVRLDNKMIGEATVVAARTRPKFIGGVRAVYNEELFNEKRRNAMKNRTQQNITQRIVIAALLAAVTCVVTMIVKIPSPLKGYLNLGDCVVLTAGWMLSPMYGFLAAGLGSALADLFAGYVAYVPATFVIKGVMALVAFYGYKLTHRKLGNLSARIMSGTVAEIVMILCYFLFEGILYGFGPSVVNIPANAVQGVAGLVLGIILMNMFEKIIIK